MFEFIYLVLAAFWLWATVRYALEQFAGRLFAATRSLHPLVVAALPLVVLWPDWVRALAVAGATGLLIALTDHTLSPTPATPVQLPRRRLGNLPPLP